MQINNKEGHYHMAFCLKMVFALAKSSIPSNPRGLCMNDFASEVPYLNFTYSELTKHRSLVS